MINKNYFSLDVFKQAFSWIKRTSDIGKKNISDEMILIQGKLYAYIPEKTLNANNNIVPQKSVLILSKHSFKEIIVTDKVFKELIDINKVAKTKIKECLVNAYEEKMFLENIINYKGTITEIDDENEIVLNPAWIRLLKEAQDSNQDLFMGMMFYTITSIILSRPVFDTGCWLLDKMFVGGYYKLFVGGTTTPILYVTGRDLFDGLDQNKIILLKD